MMVVAAIAGVIFQAMILLGVLEPEPAEASPGALTIQLQSGTGNIVAGVPIGVRITATDSSFSGSVNLRDDTGTLTPAATGNFTNGVWTGSVIIYEATTTKITAEWDAITQISTSTFTVKPNDASPQISILDGNGQSGQVATSLSKPLKIKTLDPYGNTLVGRNVYFTIESSPNGTSGTQLSRTAAVTNSSGEATTELKLGTRIGQYVVRASTSGDSETFNLNATAGTLSEMSIIPSAVLAVPGSSQQFSLTAKDQHGNPITLSSVSWRVQNGGGNIDSNGLFTASSQTGSFANTIAASVGSVQATASVTVISGQSSGGGGEDDPDTEEDERNIGILSRVEILPQDISVSSGTQQLISAQGFDVFNNALATISYGWELTGEVGSLLSGNGPTTLLDASVLPGTGSLQVTATQGEVSVTAQTPIRVVAGTNGKIEFGEVESPKQAGTPFTITITAKDASDNIVGSTPTPIVLSDSTGTISPRVITELSAGVWTGEVTIHSAAEDVVILANAAGFSGASNGFAVEGESVVVTADGHSNPVLGFVDNNKVAFAIVAGLGMLGSVVALGLIVSRGLQAIGRNPLAKKQIFVNLYLNAGVAIMAAIISIALAMLLQKL